MNKVNFNKNFFIVLFISMGILNKYTSINSLFTRPKQFLNKTDQLLKFDFKKDK